MSTEPAEYITRDNAVAAKDIADNLLSSYGVTIEEDWGDHAVRSFQWKWPPLSSHTEWKNGRWTIVELQTVAEALSDLAELMGGATQFRAFVGPTRVKMAASTCGRGCTPRCGRSVTFLDAGHPPAKVEVQNSSNIDKWTVVHEFGHAWDRNSRWQLSAKLEQHTQGHTSWLERLMLKDRDKDKRLPGCNNTGYFYGGCPPKGSDAGFTRKEDFAESVTASVYPVEAQSMIAHYAENTLYSSLYYADFKSTERWRYIQAVINREIAV
jgi:hypothetical protein